jgi:hypothetical protein
MEMMGVVWEQVGEITGEYTALRGIKIQYHGLDMSVFAQD